MLLQIWSHLLEKFVTENSIFCAVSVCTFDPQTCSWNSHLNFRISSDYNKLWQRKNLTTTLVYLYQLTDTLRSLSISWHSGVFYPNLTNESYIHFRQESFKNLSLVKIRIISEPTSWVALHMSWLVSAWYKFKLSGISRNQSNLWTLLKHSL